MSKPIRKSCAPCCGSGKVYTNIPCGRCHGKKHEVVTKKEPCKSCNATGRYVRKVGNHKHIVRTCRRCRGTAVYIHKEEGKACRACKGRGTVSVPKQCTSCKGKGKVTVNGISQFWPEGAEKKLALS
jgi:DnaJ-class molecular chaperone